MNGLPENILEKLKSVFVKHPEIQSVMLFGSRARGDFKKNSDIDLAVRFFQSEDKLAKLKWDLDELPLIHKLDVVDYDRIESPKFKEKIDGEGVVVYGATEN